MTHCTCILSRRNPLKFTVDEKNNVKLFPEDDEPIDILNIKRGLISALAVPVLEEEQNKKMVSHSVFMHCCNINIR